LGGFQLDARIVNVRTNDELFVNKMGFFFREVKGGGEGPRQKGEIQISNFSRSKEPHVQGPGSTVSRDLIC
jgi:hypothetical protein